jgi:predicted transcriptional regulator
MYTNLSLIGLLGKILQARFRYRDRSKIIGDILDSISSDPRGKTKTSIMRGANLSFDQTNKYVNFLILCDVVKAVDPLGSQEVARYRLTEKGFRFLKDFETWRYAFELLYRKAVI